MSRPIRRKLFPFSPQPLQMYWKTFGIEGLSGQTVIIGFVYRKPDLLNRFVKGNTFCWFRLSSLTTKFIVLLDKSRPFTGKRKR